jgi:hydrogenase nickel incorporation protein HypA/HybF
MHETAIAAELLRLAEEHASLYGEGPVSVVGVRVGAMSGVVAEALEFAFDALKAETRFDGAKLVVEHIPLRARCPQCRQETSPAPDLILWCSRCGSALDIISGRELDLAFLELPECPASQ